MEDLTKALQYLCEKFNEAEQLKTIVINGRAYSGRALQEIREKQFQADLLKVYDLDSFVSMAMNEISNYKHVHPLRAIVESNDQVSLISSLNDDGKYERIISSSARIPNIRFDEYMSVEQMIIMLMTDFQQTQNCKDLIHLLSTMGTRNEATVHDDGFTQTVTVTDGAQMKTNVLINPLVILKPFRTFYELEQPESMFLIRVNKNGSVALFDADGGIYQNYCMEAIRDFLEAQFDGFKETEVIVG